MFWSCSRALGAFDRLARLVEASTLTLRESALTALRPCAMGLCDTQDFHDFRFKSALGRNDGDVYPAIMEAARRDPLNSATSSERGVGVGYEESLKKLIVGGVGVYRGKTGRKENGLSGTVSKL